MKEIVQLEKYDYNKLVEMANLNEEQISKKAEEMYKQKGCPQIEIKFDMGNSHNAFIFDTKVWIWDNNKYEVPYEVKKKFVKEAKYALDNVMRKKFGSQIKNINLWNERVEKLRNCKIKFIGLTIFGWLAALALVIINLTGK